MTAISALAYAKKPWCYAANRDARSYYTGASGEVGDVVIIAARDAVLSSSASPAYSFSTTTVGALVFGDSLASSAVSLFIRDLGNNLVLLEPLAVSVQRSEAQFLAYSFDLDEMGSGETESEALNDLRAAIAESYFLLRDEQDKLGPVQQRHWNYLSRVARTG